MNNNFTPEEKLRIIDLLAVTQSKKEFLDAVNKLLSEESKKEALPPQEESISLPEDTKVVEEPPKEENFIKYSRWSKYL